ncbi:unnamed protein product [Closterium sp. NIES-54]
MTHALLSLDAPTETSASASAGAGAVAAADAAVTPPLLSPDAAVTPPLLSPDSPTETSAGAAAAAAAVTPPLLSPGVAVTPPLLSPDALTETAAAATVVPSQISPAPPSPTCLNTAYGSGNCLRQEHPQAPQRPAAEANEEGTAEQTGNQGVRRGEAAKLRHPCPPHTPYTPKASTTGSGTGHCGGDDCGVTCDTPDGAGHEGDGATGATGGGSRVRQGPVVEGAAGSAAAAAIGVVATAAAAAIAVVATTAAVATGAAATAAAATAVVAAVATSTWHASMGGSSAPTPQAPRPLGLSAPATAATVATTAPAFCATMASLRVLAFDHEGRPVQFDRWLNDLQLYLQSDSKDSVSLFDLESSAATAPPATAYSAPRSQWLTHDAAAV